MRGEIGGCIVKITIGLAPEKGRLDRKTLKECLQELALQYRYSGTGEGEMYEQECPVFKRHGIERD
jgi:hypothetical protein